MNKNPMQTRVHILFELLYVTEYNTIFFWRNHLINSYNCISNNRDRRVYPGNRSCIQSDSFKVECL